MNIDLHPNLNVNRRTMDFKRFLGTGLFLLAAAFSLTDVGTDIALVINYAISSKDNLEQKSVLSTKTKNETGEPKEHNNLLSNDTWPTEAISNANCSKKSSGALRNITRSPTKSKNKNSTNEFEEFLSKIKVMKTEMFFWLTSFWIFLGGFFQTITILRQILCSCQDDSLLVPFSWPLRFVLLIAAPFLLAPFVANVFGASLIFRQQPNAFEDVTK